MKARPITTIQGTIQDVRFMDDRYVEPAATKAANSNDPTKPTLFARFVAYMDAWTNASYEAWEKAGRPPRDYI